MYIDFKLWIAKFKKLDVCSEGLLQSQSHIYADVKLIHSYDVVVRIAIQYVTQSVPHM